MRPKIAVILFPGTNCELEVLRACERSKMHPEIFRWNEKKSKLKQFDAFIIPGGFSYEDRGRSGIIASKDPIVETLKKEAQKGKVMLGICNGAQILIEADLIPGISKNNLEMCLSWNERMKKGKILGVGFYNEWIHMRTDCNSGRSAFNKFSKDTIMRIPIAHGEGRFTTQDKNLLQNLINNQQTLFRYCNEKGEFIDEFPTNPNGALYNLAGVCNKEGNIMSLMPHPERTTNGQPIFDSMAAYLTKKYKLVTPPAKKSPSIKPVEDTITELEEKPDIVITSELIITDNAERTIENTMKNKGYKNLKLKRSSYFAINTKSKKKLINTAKKIITSGEIVNLNKEVPTIIIGDKKYSYDKTTGLHEIKRKTSSIPTLWVAELNNYEGKRVHSKLKDYFPSNEIVKVEKGVQWKVHLKQKKNLEKLVKTHIFHNPHAMKIISV